MILTDYSVGKFTQEKHFQLLRCGTTTVPARDEVRTVGRVRTPSGVISDLSPAIRAEVTTTGVAPTPDQNPAVRLDVWPNPAERDVRITAHTTLTTSLRIEICSLDGRTLATLYDGTVVGTASAYWNAAAPGVYLVVARGNGMCVVEPLVVVR
ncbi:MAG: hypothetical protein KatS3mg039_0182 [Candidatus Kapaibacterium sp.]|nr:MAG: hypothetical protein KatS3mg039_0182 [Candidatus Kapabacteria bacterium]